MTESATEILTVQIPKEYPVRGPQLQYLLQFC